MNPANPRRATVNRPTMADVAERAKVSRALVSLVMNNSPQVSKARRESVLRAADELGYQPNLMARNLAQRHTSTIGVVVDDLRNPFFGTVVDGIEMAADKHGFRVLILNGHRDPRREKAAVENFLQLRVEGLALIGNRLDNEELARIGLSVPAVAVASGDMLPAVDTVVTDGRRGAELAVEHLLGLGHRRIVHVDGATNVSASERRDGYCGAMRSAQLSEEIDVRTGGDDEVDARRVIDGLGTGPNRPTAIFAFNDMLAAGLLDLLDSAGVAVPMDMSLVGFDNTFIAGLGRLSLTTIDQPRLKMGRLAMATLLERIGGSQGEPVRHTLEPELVVRLTTGPPPCASHHRTASA